VQNAFCTIAGKTSGGSLVPRRYLIEKPGATHHELVSVFNGLKFVLSDEKPRGTPKDEILFSTEMISILTWDEHSRNVGHPITGRSMFGQAPLSSTAMMSFAIFPEPLKNHLVSELHEVLLNRLSIPLLWG